MLPSPEQLDAWRKQLDCSFPAVQAVFADCMLEATRVLGPVGLDAYLNCARSLGKMGRGPEPVLALMQEWPQVAATVGEDTLADVDALLFASRPTAPPWPPC